ncbi:Uncharacterised protein [Klebsiella michiganensis]|uniref:Uncharacterized protein n=1 Tax=Klebsiella michiganensis TaxID=1134687 RepID=A0A7H4M505_9ENTR|nr:Uncharacterised protein [Klebsiella michiganensis]
MLICLYSRDSIGDNYQLAFFRPGISPRIAASRTLIRLNPNFRRNHADDLFDGSDYADETGWNHAAESAA